MNRKIKFKLKEHIEKQGMNQKQFSQQIGLREATISQMVNNKYDRVQLNHLLIIMDYLNTSDFNDILEITEE